tara:strand:+ start:7549 stop:7806 length:258 start_codon:yes stop_codon:yes gene_type:complete
LEGAAPPAAWIVSRICEEFGCLPSEAVSEMEKDVRKHLFQIMQMRCYAAAKRRLDDMKPGENLDDVPMIDVVLKTDIAIAKGEIT